MSFIQTLITTILATGSAFLASHLTNKANLKRLQIQFDIENKREKRRQRVEMLEQIYNSIYIWNGSTVTRHLSFISLLKEQISWQKYLDSVNGIATDSDIQLGIIEIRINSNFPELIPHWDKIVEYFREMAKYNINYAKAMENGVKINTELLEPSQKAITNFLTTVKTIKSELISLSRAA